MEQSPQMQVGYQRDGETERGNSQKKQNEPLKGKKETT